MLHPLVSFSLAYANAFLAYVNAFKLVVNVFPNAFALILSKGANALAIIPAKGLEKILERCGNYSRSMADQYLPNNTYLMIFT